MPSILVIEDDPIMRLVMEEILHALKYKVLCANDGMEGLKLARVLHPDLILTDILMPEMEGIELIQRLREDVPHTPILAMSGGGEITAELALRSATAMGACAVLYKPFDLRQLQEVLALALAKRPKPGPDNPASYPATGS